MIDIELYVYREREGEREIEIEIESFFPLRREGLVRGAYDAQSAQRASPERPSPSCVLRLIDVRLRESETESMSMAKSLFSPFLSGHRVTGRTSR